MRLDRCGAGRRQSRRVEASAGYVAFSVASLRRTADEARRRCRPSRCSHVTQSRKPCRSCRWPPRVSLLDLLGEAYAKRWTSKESRCARNRQKARKKRTNASARTTLPCTAAPCGVTTISQTCRDGTETGDSSRHPPHCRQRSSAGTTPLCSELSVRKQLGGHRPLTKPTSNYGAPTMKGHQCRAGGAATLGVPHPRAAAAVCRSGVFTAQAWLRATSAGPQPLCRGGDRRQMQAANTEAHEDGRVDRSRPHF